MFVFKSKRTVVSFSKLSTFSNCCCIKNKKKTNKISKISLFFNSERLNPSTICKKSIVTFILSF